MWDLHHCLSATRRGSELAPRIDALLKEARSRGALVIHAPSGCMAPYKTHPARLRAQAMPRSAHLPPEIGQWCKKIPTEEQGNYPVDQTDGGEDDDLAEHARWQARLTAPGQAILALMDQADRRNRDRPRKRPDLGRRRRDLECAGGSRHQQCDPDRRSPEHVRSWSPVRTAPDGEKRQERDSDARSYGHDV